MSRARAGRTHLDQPSFSIIAWPKPPYFGTACTPGSFIAPASAQLLLVGGLPPACGGRVPLDTSAHTIAALLTSQRAALLLDFLRLAGHTAELAGSSS